MDIITPRDRAFGTMGNGLTGGRRPVLVLQGGGALGSYQAGAFEALAEAGVQPEWVAGVSIGAINASLIAGNAPERRVERLHAFWNRITAPTALWPHTPRGPWRALEKRAGALAALLLGQPGFFRPRLPFEWLDATQPVSFYDTGELRGTLEELVDFDRINAGGVRLSVGAVDVESGNLVYFDSRDRKIRPEHVMASSALPPGLPMIEIGGRAFWDGGLVSNTPLRYVMADTPRQNSVVFQVDLFPARGQRPASLDEVAERAKDIRFSSRTRATTTVVAERQNLRRQVAAFLQRLPAEFRDDPLVARMRAFSCEAEIDVVHLIYRPGVPQGPQKDVQFDRPTMQARWAHGLADGRRSLAAAPWLEPFSPDQGMRTFDVPAQPPSGITL